MAPELIETASPVYSLALRALVHWQIEAARG